MQVLTEECSGFFGIGRRWTAVLTIVIEADGIVSAQWDQARCELLQWSKKRGDKRRAIDLVFFTHPSRFDDVRRFLQSDDLWSMEVDQLFREFPPTVSFMTPDGDCPERFQLEPPNQRRQLTDDPRDGE